MNKLKQVKEEYFLIEKALVYSALIAILIMAIVLGAMFGVAYILDNQKQKGVELGWSLLQNDIKVTIMRTPCGESFRFYDGENYHDLKRAYCFTAKNFENHSAISQNAINLNEEILRYEGELSQQEEKE